MPSIPARSGKRSRHLIMTTVMTSSPAASAPRTQPQALIPIVSFAMTGPKVSQAPAWMALRNVNASTTTQTQVSDVKADQPSRRSLHIEGASIGLLASAGGSLTCAMKAAATSHVQASTRTAQPGPTVTTSMVPMAGPIMASPFLENASMALACWMWLFGTTCGTTPCIAGKVNARTVPLSAARTTIIQISATPVRRSTATAPWVAADKMWDSCITTVLDIRSAITPPTSRKRTSGIDSAASTMPRSVAESLISRTAKTSATGAMTDPIVEMNRPE